MPENDNGLAGDSETEQVLEHLIFLYKTRQKQSSQIFQKHRFMMVCETSAQLFSAHLCNQESEKKGFINTKNIFKTSRKQRLFETFQTCAQNQL